MYIRKTKKTEPSSKKEYFVYQLVESVRTKKGPRQHILLSLGADLGLPEEDMKLLSNRIEELFIGSNPLFPYPEEIENLAQKYTSQLIKRLSDVNEKSQTPPEEDLQTINVHTIEQQEPRTVGTEHLLLHFASQLQIQKKLKELGLSKKEIAVSLGSIIGRAVFPSGENALHTWLTCKSGLGELLNFNFQKTSPNHFYQIPAILLKHKVKLEKYLEQEQQKIYGDQSKMVLYYLINTSIKTQQTTLGLVINEHGFISRSSFVPYNILEPGTLQKAIEALSYLKPTVIIDNAFASKDNLTWLRNHTYNYVIFDKQNLPSTDQEGPSIPIENSNETHVQTALVTNDGVEEKWLYCESEAKRAITSQKENCLQQRFENDLKNISESLLKPKGRKKYVNILKRIVKLKEKHRLISGYYEIYMESSRDGQLATAIKWVLKPKSLEERLNGHYFLRTNLTQLSTEKLWNLSNSLVERQLGLPLSDNYLCR